MKAIIKGLKGFKSKIKPPADKSISHRAAIFAALAEGESQVSNFLLAQDCLATVEALKSLGVDIFLDRESARLRVNGKGINGLREPENIINAHNSASTMRMIAGLASSFPFLTVITGDNSLRRRPMDRIIKPLTKMGAVILSREQKFAPLCIKGGKLKGINYTLPVASAQLKTALILAALRASGNTLIKEPLPSRDHSERILKNQGADIKVEKDSIKVRPAEKLNPLNFSVPGDFSSAAFFLVAALISPGSEIKIEGVNLNPSRTGLLDVLRQMGAKIEFEILSKEIEPLGNLIVSSSSLKSVDVTGPIWPRMIDEGPILFVAMALAEGKSVVSGASELRVKETDRIKAMAEELSKMGARVEEKEDGLAIEGVESLKGAVVNSYGDHRIAMALAVAALRAEGETVIEDAGCVKVSFPNFFETLQKACGAEVYLVK